LISAFIFINYYRLSRLDLPQTTLTYLHVVCELHQKCWKCSFLHC